MAKQAPCTTAISATPNLTRDWIDHHLVHHDLQRRITYSVKSKWVKEDWDEIHSWVGEILTIWRANDALATYVSAGTLTMARVARWCKIKYQNVLFSRGTEPICREWQGYRSEVEYLASREAGLDTIERSEVATQSSGDGHTAVNAYAGGDHQHPAVEGDLWGQVEIIALDPTPEDRVEFAHDAEAALVEGRRLIEATFRDATPRYLRVFHYLYVDNLGRAEIAEKEGCTTQRVSQLSTRVRNCLRDGRVIREDAQRLMAYLSGQQDKTADWESVKDALRIDKPRLNRAVAYRNADDTKIEVKKDSAGRTLYSLTR